MRVKQHSFPPATRFCVAFIKRTTLETKVKSGVDRQTMPTPRETILAALHARLLALPATALRGGVLPERGPAAGLLILRDGEPGEPEVTLSPLRYHYQHRAEIEAVVQGAERDMPRHPRDHNTTNQSLRSLLSAARVVDVVSACKMKSCLGPQQIFVFVSDYGRAKNLDP